jgi:hypothetical protein
MSVRMSGASAGEGYWLTQCDRPIVGRWWRLTIAMDMLDGRTSRIGLDLLRYGSGYTIGYTASLSSPNARGSAVPRHRPSAEGAFEYFVQPGRRTYASSAASSSTTAISRSSLHPCSSVPASTSSLAAITRRPRRVSG